MYKFCSLKIKNIIKRNQRKPKETKRYTMFMVWETLHC